MNGVADIIVMVVIIVICFILLMLVKILTKGKLEFGMIIDFLEGSLGRIPWMCNGSEKIFKERNVYCEEVKFC